jgi:hypothetical protein
MPGSATLGTKLIDPLVSVLDDIRTTVNTDLEVRQFRVWTVQRSYSSGTIGDGDYTDVTTEITPRPIVESWMGSLGRSLEPCGIDEAGLVRLTEVSLSYTYAELTGGSLAAGIDWFIKLTDAHGQGQPDRWFTIAKPPYPDRIKTIGWIVELQRISDSG